MNSTERLNTLIATSDCHLDRNTWANRLDIAGDSQIAFEQICQHALLSVHDTREPNTVLIAAGDLLDKQRNLAEPVGTLRRELDKLEEADVPVLYVQGQHEAQPVPWLSEIHRWPIWLDKYCRDNGPYRIGQHESYEEGYLVIWGIDWTPRELLPARLAEIPSDVNVLVMHQVCEAWMGDVCTPEFSFDDIPPHVRLLIIGDYHKHLIENGPRPDCTILSPGSTSMREISEESIKSFFQLNFVSDVNEPTIESITLRTRSCLEQEILMEEQLDTFVANIPFQLAHTLEMNKYDGVNERLLKPLLRVHYRVDLPGAYARIKAAVGDKAHLFFDEILPPRDEASPGEIAAEVHKEISELGLVGCLPRVVSPEDDPEAFNMCERLLNSENPAQSLREMRIEYGLTPDRG